MQSHLRHHADPRDVRLGRAATVVLIVCFAAWLAGFGVAAPWDVAVHVDVAEFFGRLAGLLLLLALIFAPLAIAAAAGPRRR